MKKMLLIEVPETGFDDQYLYLEKVFEFIGKDYIKDYVISYRDDTGGRLAKKLCEDWDLDFVGSLLPYKCNQKEKVRIANRMAKSADKGLVFYKDKDEWCNIVVKALMDNGVESKTFLIEENRFGMLSE